MKGCTTCSGLPGLPHTLFPGARSMVIKSISRRLAYFDLSVFTTPVNCVSHSASVVNVQLTPVKIARSGAVDPFGHADVSACDHTASAGSAHFSTKASDCHFASQ